MPDINLNLRGGGGQQTAAEVDVATRALRRYTIAAEEAAAAGAKLHGGAPAALPMGGFPHGAAPYVQGGYQPGGMPVGGMAGQLPAPLASQQHQQMRQRAEAEANRQLNQKLHFSRVRTQEEAVEQARVQAEQQNQRRQNAALAQKEREDRANAARQAAEQRRAQVEARRQQVAEERAQRQADRQRTVADAQAAKNTALQHSRIVLNQPDLMQHLQGQVQAGFSAAAGARNLGLVGNDARIATAQLTAFNRAQKQAAQDANTAAAAFKASGVSLQDLQNHMRATGATTAQTTAHFRLSGAAATGATMAMRQASQAEAAIERARMEKFQRREHFQDMAMMGGMASAAGGALLAPIGYGIGQFGKSQLTRIGVEGLEGADSERVIGQARMDAKNTFGMDYRGILDAQRLFREAGEDINQAREATIALSDAVAGVGKDSETLQRVLINLGQIRAQAKLSAVDLKQLDIAGLGGTKRIARGLGISQGELRERMGRGEVSGEQAFRVLIAEWKREFGGRGQQITESTLPGQFDKARDNLNELSEVAGETVAPTLMKLGKAANSTIEWLQDHPKVAAGATYGALGVGGLLAAGGLAAGVRGSLGMVGTMLPDKVMQNGLMSKLFGGGVMQQAGTQLLTASVNLNAAATKLSLTGGIPGVVPGAAGIIPGAATTAGAVVAGGAQAGVGGGAGLAGAQAAAGVAGAAAGGGGWWQRSKEAAKGGLTMPGMTKTQFAAEEARLMAALQAETKGSREAAVAASKLAAHRNGLTTSVAADAAGAVGLGGMAGRSVSWGNMGAGALTGAVGGFQTFADMERAGHDQATSLAAGAFVGVAEAAISMFVPGGAVAVAMVEGARMLWNMTQAPPGEPGSGTGPGETAFDAEPPNKRDMSLRQRAADLEKRAQQLDSEADNPGGLQMTWDALSARATGPFATFDGSQEETPWKVQKREEAAKLRQRATHLLNKDKAAGMHAQEAAIEADTQEMWNRNKRDYPEFVTNAPDSSRRMQTGKVKRQDDEGTLIEVYVPHAPVVRDLNQALRARGVR